MSAPGSSDPIDAIDALVRWLPGLEFGTVEVRDVVRDSGGDGGGDEPAARLQVYLADPAGEEGFWPPDDILALRQAIHRYLSARESDPPQFVLEILPETADADWAADDVSENDLGQAVEGEPQRERPDSA